MLPLRRQAMVLGYHGPAVGKLAYIRAACIDHGLDGKRHSRLERHTGVGTAVVQNLRLFVKLAADAVTAELAYHRKSILLGMSLYRMADIAEPGAWSHDSDSPPQALISHVTQAACLDRGLPDVEHAAGVAVIAILDHGDVDVDDVAGLQTLFARHAVTYHMVYRSADRTWKRLIAGRRVIQRRRYGALLCHHVLMADVVDLGGGDAGLDKGPDMIENFACEPTGDPHFFNLLCGFDGHWHNGMAQKLRSID